MLPESTRSPSEIQADCERLTSRIRKAARNHSGHVIEAYVENIIERVQRGNFEEDVAGRYEEFLGKLGEKDRAGRDRRLAAPLALCGAAGSIAIEDGLLPLSKARLSNALRRCFRGARAALASQEAIGADLEKLICEWLCTEAEMVPFKGVGHRIGDESKYDAFRISGEEGEYLLLRMERLLERFAVRGGKTAVQSALKCMQRNGGLKTYQNGAAFTRQFQVGEGARRRFLVLGCQYVQSRAGYEPGALDAFGGDDLSDLGLRTEAAAESDKIEGGAPKPSGARRIRRKRKLRRVRRAGSISR
jgi:hypothetical protein